MINSLECEREGDILYFLCIGGINSERNIYGSVLLTLKT